MISKFRLLLFSIVFLSLAARASSDDTPAVASLHAPELKGQALILVGLPGDAEHEELFTGTTKQWRRWLTGKLGFHPDEIHVLFGTAAKAGVSEGPATREGIEKEAARLKQSLGKDDRLWVFFLGHANFDGEHAWFHLPGPDFNEEELGKLFAGIECREQVFWMTTSESGRFVKSFSAKGRTVIAATRAGGEDNETEFPHALSAVAERSLADLDIDKNGQLSLLEFYYRVIIEAQARYTADKRLPTEHAQLDDNGDGVGVEQPLAGDEDKNDSNADGVLSHSTILPYAASPSKEEPPKQIERKDN
jgi:hypothetical protein